MTVYNQYNSPGREARFWEKVERTIGCWIWTGAHVPDGYGSFMDGGHSRKAHRVAWELAFGEIPVGMHVLHTCDNRTCVNPRHLYLGTNADNVRDRVARGRTGDHRGHRNPNAKLTPFDVWSIRRRRANGERRADIARAFGVDGSTIGRITGGKSWKG